MATKTATFQIKRSGTASSVPASLLAGEPALNTTDKKLYSSDGTTVFQVAPSMAEHATKAPLASPTFTGTASIPSIDITGSSGSEGGQITLAKAPSGTISSAITFDVVNDIVRLFAVKDSTTKGYSFPITSPAGIVSIVDRANHTGTQAISTVAGLQAALDAKLAAASYTADDVLTKLKTVDGSSSGLDADLVRGTTPSSFGLSLLNGTSASEARTTLGLGTAAVSNSADFAPSTHVGSTSGHPLVTSSVAGFMSPEDKRKFEYLVGPFYWVQFFGAVGDNVADDTAAIQAAIDAACSAGRGTVRLPPGIFKITATLIVWASNVNVIGSGRGVTFVFPRMATADAFYIGKPGVGVLNRNQIDDFTIYSQTTDPTGGALVHVCRCSNFSAHGLEVSAGFGGIWLESVINSDIAAMVYGDANMTALAVGSFLVKISTYPGGAISSNIDLCGSKLSGQTGLHRIETALLINEVDGVWLDWYTGWTKYGIHLAPASDTAKIYSIVTDEIYLDNIEKYAIYFTEPSTDYAGECGFHKFNLGTVHLCEAGVVWSGQSNHDTLFSGGKVQNIGTHAFNLLKGSNISIADCSVEGVNTSGTTGGGALIGAATSNVRIDNLSVRKGLSAYAPTFGVRAVAGADDFMVSGLKLSDCLVDVLDETTTTNKRIFPWKRSSGLPAIASAATIAFPPDDVFTITGTVNVTDITGTAWLGRTVRFICTSGGVTFSAGATIAITVTTTANKPATAVYAGTKWYITA